MTRYIWMALETLTHDRRGSRSNDTLIATTLQLEHIYRRYEIDQIALASEDGLLLACAGDLEAATWLAAFAPELSEGRRAALRASLEREVPSIAESDLFISPLSVRGQRLYLIATCAPGRAAARVATKHAYVGVRRIFETTP